MCHGHSRGREGSRMKRGPTKNGAGWSWGSTSINSPEVRATPFAIVWLPWVWAVIRHLFDSTFIHWARQTMTKNAVRKTLSLPKLCTSRNTHWSASLWIKKSIMLSVLMFNSRVWWHNLAAGTKQWGKLTLLMSVPLRFRVVVNTLYCLVISEAKCNSLTWAQQNGGISISAQQGLRGLKNLQLHYRSCSDQQCDSPYILML